MGGTKIIVVQLKEIIKSAIFALIGLLLIVLLIYFFMPREQQTPQSNAAQYEPGTYVSDIMLQDSPINIAVTVTDEEIVAIELENMTEAQEVFYPLVKPALQEISQEILAQQTTNVAFSSEYSITGETLLLAIRSALAQATPTETTE